LRGQESARFRAAEPRGFGFGRLDGRVSLVDFEGRHAESLAKIPVIVVQRGLVAPEEDVIQRAVFRSPLLVLAHQVVLILDGAVEDLEEGGETEGEGLVVGLHR